MSWEADVRVLNLRQIQRKRSEVSERRIVHLFPPMLGESILNAEVELVRPPVRFFLQLEVRKETGA